MISEKITVGEGGEYPLNGLLTLPDGEGPFPAVVMVHGSGPSDMDERVMKLTPFKDLAEGLAGHGIVSLRFDKRTYAHKEVRTWCYVCMNYIWRCLVRKTCSPALFSPLFPRPPKAVVVKHVVV